MKSLPAFYPILDAAFFPTAGALLEAARELVAGGASLLQYRDKSSSARDILERARELRRSLPAHVQLIMNDRADLCLAAEFDGVHAGQDDLSPDAARTIIGPDRWLGVSTHNADQLVLADQTSADYLAIGPVFATASKKNPDPVVGLEGLQSVRRLTQKKLVAIGGITRHNCRSVIQAGADSVAVISDLIPDPRKSAEEFFRILR